MNSLLVCPRIKGNTFDIATYVTENSDAELLILNQMEDVDLGKYRAVILCSGVYGGNIHKNLLKWLNEIEKSQSGVDTKFYLLLTWFGRGHSDEEAFKKVESLFEKSNFQLETDYMTSYGGKALIRYGHPNEDDFEKVLRWVKLKI